MNYGLQFFKLIIGLLVLTFTLRILGKNTMAQLTPYDLVYIIVFGGIIDSTFYDDKIGIIPFIFSAFIWSLSIYIIEFLVRKFHVLRMLFRGVPDLIMENGKFNMKLFKKNNLEMEQLRIILRQKGIFSLKEVKDIYLEPDGNFSVNMYVDYQPIVNSTFNIKNDEDPHNILLIDEGKIETTALKYIDRSVEWLSNEMLKLGITDMSEILYCEWSDNEEFYYKSASDIVSNEKKEFTN